MKEIDLLPEWYKSSKKHHNAMRVQYAALGLVLFLMILWTLLAGSSIKNARAQLTELESKRVSMEKIVRQYSELSGIVEQLRQNKITLEKVDSHLDISSTLAELSFLLDDGIIINRLAITAEKIGKDTTKLKVSDTGGLSRSGSETLSGPVRFAVRMTGFAVNSGKVADLICRLEESLYFCKAVPLYSVNKQPKGINIFTGDQTQITEFDISCFIANYDIN